ncbi:MAG: YlxR family protein [Acidimicrobiales bacterium]
MTPIRTCIGCRRKAPVSELVKIALSGEGTVVLGRNGSGRGAWICADSPECQDRSAKIGVLARAFRSPVGADAGNSLREEFARLRTDNLRW